MKIPFSKDQIIERIKFENPWWNSQKIDGYYSVMKHREYFNLFFPLVSEKKIRRAVVLMGPRRVGKTVLLYHTIQKLITDGVPPSEYLLFFRGNSNLQWNGFRGTHKVILRNHQ